MVLGACGSSESTTIGEKSGDVVGYDAESYPLPGCSLEDPASCTFEGFDPSVDGFGFENWGAPGELGATEMIALFGRDEVCANGGSGDCALYPAAQQWVDQVNEAMSGGHCEGMAVLSRLIYDGGANLADFDPAAGSTFDLSRENPTVSSAIEYWWATQMVQPVQEAFQSYQKLEPSEIATRLAEGLGSGAGYTLGIYSDQGGHAVTPIAVTDEGDSIAIHVYDNNFPGTVQRILIDPEAEQWSYAMGSTNPQAETGGWGGGQGTIELTPMKSRVAKPFPSPFGDAEEGGKTSHIMVTSADRDAEFQVVLTVDGRLYDTRDPGVSLPDGVHVRSVLGSSQLLAGNWSSITVDRAKVKTFSMALAAGGDEAATVPVTMSVDGGEMPRTTVRYEWDLEPQGVYEPMTVDADGNVAIDFADMGGAVVNVSNGLNSANLPVSDAMIADGLSLEVGALDGDGTSTIDFENEDGESLGEYELGDDSETGEVTEILAEFDPESGEFEETMSEIDAVPVDTEAIAFLEDLEDAVLDEGYGSDNGTDAGVDDGTDDNGVEDPGGTDDSGGEDPDGTDDSGGEEPGGVDDGDGTDDSGGEDGAAEE
jgi:hypothetical protein